MLRYACDWCKRLKEPEEAWILGYSAESVGTVAARREVTVVSGWDRERAVHPFAVHFCSVEHKDNYVAALFETAPAPLTERRHKPAAVNTRKAKNKTVAETVVTRTVTRRKPVPRKTA